MDGVGMWGGPGGIEGKGVSGGSSGSMGMWDEAVKNQAGLRGNTNNNMGLKNSRSSPSLRYMGPDKKKKKIIYIYIGHKDTVCSPKTSFFLTYFGRLAM